jgi:hypothetical protein
MLPHRVCITTMDWGLTCQAFLCMAAATQQQEAKSKPCQQKRHNLYPGVTTSLCGLQGGPMLRCLSAPQMLPSVMAPSRPLGVRQDVCQLSVCRDLCIEQP